MVRARVRTASAGSNFQIASSRRFLPGAGPQRAAPSSNRGGAFATRYRVKPAHRAFGATLDLQRRGTRDIPAAASERAIRAADDQVVENLIDAGDAAREVTNVEVGIVLQHALEADAFRDSPNHQ
jgi:hypothetical protein